MMMYSYLVEGLYKIITVRYVLSVIIELDGIFSKKNLNASRLSEHPSVRGENGTMFSRWNHRLLLLLLLLSSH